MAAESPASAAATALLAEFIAAGVTDLVLSPGSRSQALALAAAQFERAGLLRLRVRIDERSAAFLALGLAVETRRPVLIVVTSGTAVAELHPAVLEASHSGVPLIVLSADRPSELLGVGANQATVQPGIFAGAAEKSWDVPAPGGAVAGAFDEDPVAAARALVAEVLTGIRGPRHVNLAYREPLSSPVRLPDVEPGDWPPAPAPLEVIELQPGPGTVVVAGAGAGAEAEGAARALGAPLLAEVASGARFGPNLVAAYRELLRAANFGDRIERVVVFGHPTLSREVPALIQSGRVETIVVRGSGPGRSRDDYNPGRRVSLFADAVTVADGPAALQASRSWVGRWVQSSRAILEEQDDAAPGAALTEDYRERAEFARTQLEALRAPVTRRALALAVWNASWPHDRLVLASSRLIRELDQVAPGKKIPVHSNRGLAGIDGTIATATGIALAQQAGEGRGITRVLLGDLAMLHDAGSLLAGVGEERPRTQLIVGNDGGGTIFDGLEVASTFPTGSPDAALLDRVMLTPQRVDLAALAAAYGWEYRLVANRGELDPALSPRDERVIIEVPLER
ncbi:2-succinyl-5-enolpyruvyl-6-hydroxy-3-cyclohexene-1-carboxylic-acid synthase [soil metagenome]